MSPDPTSSFGALPEPGLRAREEHLAMAFNSALDMMMLIKVEPDVVLRIVSVNRTYLEKIRALGFDFTPGDLEGRTLAEVVAVYGFDAETIRLMRSRFEQVIRTRQVLEFREITPTSGGVFYGRTTLTPITDANGECGYILYSAQDIGAQVRAEEALRENQRVLSTLLANLAGMAYRCRNDAQWTMEFVSEGCRELTGYAPASLIGNRDISYEQIIHADDRERLRREFGEALAAGRRFEIIYRIVTAGGEVRWVLEHALAIGSEDGPVEFIEGIIMDITARKGAELALAEKERTLSAILDHSFEFIGLLDAGGRLLRANQTSLDAIGVRPPEVEGKYFWDTPWWTHSEAERQRLRDAVARAAQGEFVRFETSHPAPDGRLLHVDFSLKPVRDEQGRVVMMIPEGRDITEHKAARAALAESEEKFAKAFRSSPYLISISEVATGRYLDVNAGFERVSGYTRDEVIGRTSFELGIWVNAADREELMRGLRERGAVRGMQIDFRVKGGRIITVLCQGELIDLAGRACLLSTIEDITERRQTEKEKALLEVQLRQNQKLEALGTLAGGIAHDFNNILTAIIVNQEVALMDINSPADLKVRLNEISRASKRAKDLVHQILTFSRQQPYKRERQKLQPIAKETLSLVRASLPSTIEIVAELSADAPPARVDATQVHQILMNLCTNAAHAMRDGAGLLTVRLAAESLDEAGCRLYPGLVPGGYARLTVKDTGCGMDDEVMARLFEPFFTTKGPGEGTGLGLPVVHGIIKDYEGGIFVRSRVGEGSTFDLFFPAATEAETVQPQAPLQIHAGRGESVLLVDDEPAIGEAIAAMLRKIGYRVEKFSEPLLALERLRANPGGFDVLITDRTMPRLTGPMLVAQAQIIRPRLPAIVMSGLNSNLTDGEAAQQAIYTTIAKPPDMAGMSQAVRQALAAGKIS